MVESCHGSSVVESINSYNSAFAESNQHLVVDSPKEDLGGLCFKIQAMELKKFLQRMVPDWI